MKQGDAEGAEPVTIQRAEERSVQERREDRMGKEVGGGGAEGEN